MSDQQQGLYRRLMKISYFFWLKLESFELQFLYKISICIFLQVKQSRKSNRIQRFFWLLRSGIRVGKNRGFFQQKAQWVLLALNCWSMSTVCLNCWSMSTVSFNCWSTFTVPLSCWSMSTVSLNCWSMSTVCLNCWSTSTVSFNCWSMSKVSLNCLSTSTVS